MVVYTGPLGLSSLFLSFIELTGVTPNSSSMCSISVPESFLSGDRSLATVRWGVNGVLSYQIEAPSKASLTRLAFSVITSEPRLASTKTTRGLLGEGKPPHTPQLNLPTHRFNLAKGVNNLLKIPLTLLTQKGEREVQVLRLNKLQAVESPKHTSLETHHLLNHGWLLYIASYKKSQHNQRRTLGIT